MEEIIKIYENQIGISFCWKHSSSLLTQVIFRDIGFHLTEDELELFLDKIVDSKTQNKCSECDLGEHCRSLLLQTPSNKVSLAVSFIELNQIEELLKGTLFQIRLNNYLNEICKN